MLSINTLLKVNTCSVYCFAVILIITTWRRWEKNSTQKEPQPENQTQTADEKDRTNRRSPKPVVSTVVVKAEHVFPLLFPGFRPRPCQGWAACCRLLPKIRSDDAAWQAQSSTNQSPLFYGFTMECFYLRRYIFVFLSLQTGGSSVRLYLGTEAHARKRSHRLQTAGASIQTE